MIRQYSWKHLGIGIGLAIALYVGFLLFTQWDQIRFRKSLGETTEHISQEKNSEKRVIEETEENVEKSIQEESNSENKEIEASDKEEDDAKDLNFYDFLDFLDELHEEEFAQLIESLDLEDDEKEQLAELTESNSVTTEDVHPSSMIVDLMESGVASLAGLIELMEETTTLMSEGMQERYSNTLGTLREMQVNGGGLIFHRPPENPDGWMLHFINPSPSQRNPDFSISDPKIVHEIPSVGPNGESLWLHKGNSIIID